MKKNLLKKVVLGALVTSTLFGFSVKANTVWSQSNGKWSLTADNGSYLTGWQKVGNFWYFMGTDGIMQTGWKSIGNTWYFMNPSGDMKVGWLFDSNHWYFLNNDGSMTKGWKQVGAKWYFLNNDGSMVKGWLQLGTKWYFLNPSGDMAIGWKQVGAKWYLMDNSGSMLTGWKQVGSKWYYMDNSGAMLANTTVGGYKLGADGAWVQDTNTSDDKTVWTPASGTVKTIAGISSNWTKAQLDAVAVEAPASALNSQGYLSASDVPTDGKLYHHTDIVNYGGRTRSYESYSKYLSSSVGSDGITRNHYLRIDYSYNKITSFNEVVY